MKSLRSRLILAFALVAVIPLGIAMALLGGRVQRTITEESEQRLGDALTTLEAQLRLDGQRLSTRIDRLASDPRLLRILSEHDRSDLRSYLDESRERLDLDGLGVRDASGWIAADSMWAPGRSAVVEEPAGARTGAALVRLEHGLGLTAAALVGDPAAPFAIVRGVTRLDSVHVSRLAEASGVDLVLLDPAGRVAVSTLLGAGEIATSGKSGRVEFDGRSYLVRHVALATGPPPHARLTGFVSTASADQAMNALWIAALVLALFGVVLAVILGLAWSRQVAQPVERLAEFSERISRGDWEEPLAMESARELETLVGALERMRFDLHVYRDRLRAGERQAAYGQMARKVAHEIKNPLTPIAVSVEGLRRSYEQQRADFPQVLDEAVRVIGEEVHTLKRLIQEFSDFGRFPAPQIARFEVAELFGELATLYAGPVHETRLRIEPPAAQPLDGDRIQLKQALLNLIQNGLDASAPAGHVTLRGHATGEHLEIEVADDGPGLSPEQAAQLFVPGFTTKAHGSGLGLTIVERIVSDHGGSITARSEPGRGTTFRILLPRPRGN